MSARRRIIAVAGDAAIAPGSTRYLLAEEVGRRLVDAGFRVLTGGLGGVMEAASSGARTAKGYHDGDVIALLPGRDPTEANAFADVVLPTGLDHARNVIVAMSDALIAIGGGAGTLTEIAHAWMEKRLIIALRTDGWSGRLADQRIDHRIRYPGIPDDRVYGADNAEQAVDAIVRLLPSYADRHHGVVRRSNRESG